jgi:hypothetical protein
MSDHTPSDRSAADLPAPDREAFDKLADILRAPQPPAAPFDYTGDTDKTAAALAVYRNNIHASLSKALADKFPVVAQLVGEEFFKFAANEYFNTAPPSSPLIANYGDRFPQFLDAFEPARSVPYLADMAQLEIAWLEAYRAADADPLDAQAILAAGDGDPSDLVFTLHPSLRLFKSPFAVGSIWRRHQSDAAPEDINASAGECILIVRPEREVRLSIISAGAFAALERLHAGENVADALGHAAMVDDSFDPQATFEIILGGGCIIAAARE